MLYFIHAVENIYQGLHGIEDYCVVDVENEKEAINIGQELSYQVIESYIDDNDLDIDEDTSEEEREELINEDLCFYWFPIKPEIASSKSIDELNDLAFDYGSEDFIEKYCDNTF